jgi:thiamine-phosphate pyrophosphorylase
MRAAKGRHFRHRAIKRNARGSSRSGLSAARRRGRTTRRPNSNGVPLRRGAAARQIERVMTLPLTPAAERALAAAARWHCGDSTPCPPGLRVLLGLLDEPESRSAQMLAARGIEAAAVMRAWPALRRHENAGGAHARVPLGEIRAALATIEESLGDCRPPVELATEHLLWAVALAGGDVSRWLAEKGLGAGTLECEIRRLYGYASGPMAWDESARSPPSAAASEQTAALRMLDAAANRANEGLRVIEDYARFALDDAHLTQCCKDLRHELAAALAFVPAAARLAARETLADVGTTLAAAGEYVRPDLAALAAANAQRVEQSLRGLEECAKLLDRAAAAKFEAIRYRVYTLERSIHVTGDSRRRLAGVRLCVLVDGGSSPDDFARRVESLVAAGVPMLQLRDKNLGDRDLIDRARRMRAIVPAGKSLFIVNDRPDVAALARADGVHLGQEDASVKDARAIVGPEMLIGVSTHSLEQARRAVLAGAGYIGVGPTFASSTKSFERLAGLDLARAVAGEITLPAFALGGINHENVGEVLAAGMTRVAVSAAVTAAADPAEAARELLKRLHGTRHSHQPEA